MCGKGLFNICHLKKNNKTFNKINFSSYCDNFENKCKPCEEICSDGSDLSDCRSYCRHYLTNIVHLYSSHNLQPDQLHVLTIMVRLVPTNVWSTSASLYLIATRCPATFSHFSTQKWMVKIHFLWWMISCQNVAELLWTTDRSIT